jgi:RHS repeat-associated protein
MVSMTDWKTRAGQALRTLTQHRAAGPVLGALAILLVARYGPVPTPLSAPLSLARIGATAVIYEDTCKWDGGTATCRGPQVTAFRYQVASVNLGNQGDSESNAIAAYEQAFRDTYKPCTLTLSNLPWQPLPSATPAGNAETGNYSAALLQGIGEYHSWAWALWHEYNQTKIPVRIAATLSTNSVPACQRAWDMSQMGAAYVHRVRDVMCPDGYWRSYSSSPGSYCYRRPTDIDKAKNLGKQCPLAGNPINPATGNKYQAETDYSGTGPMPLTFARHYNSQAAGYETVAPALNIGRGSRLGYNWRSSFDRNLLYADGGPLPTVTAYRPDGRVLYFTLINGQFVPEVDIPDTLSRLTDTSGSPLGWQYTTSEDVVEVYDVEGRLVTLTNRAGLTQTLSYDSKGRVSSVADPFGHQLGFSYNGDGLIATMTDPAGGLYSYTYNTTGRLTSVTYPDGKVRTYIYSELANTANTNQPFALTGILDENGNRFATFKYDGSGYGRAISSEHADGADKVTLSSPSSSTTVTDTMGTPRTFSFQTILGVVKNAGISQPCATCGGPAAQSTSYDANGNVAARTDFKGNKTTYAYDLIRNLELSRTEGLTSTGGVTASTRTVSTEWHGTWRLPTRIAEPKRITTNVYDATGATCGAKGALCSRSIQATTDANGSQGFSATPTGTARTWTYTYNAQGQVLTVNGPRTDVSDLTTYTYDAQGNVATVKNAVNQTTQIPVYDAHGRPKKVIDPNGLITQLDYTPRGWLKTRAVGSETTTYDYDGVGQLLKVALPDNSYISYTYDAAHRLTDIQDNFGNKLHYTLDLMGNRTKEDVTDPAGTLAQTRSRVYDSLNRLSQDLGAQASEVTRYTYDPQGNLQASTDALGNVTSHSYDGLNRLSQSTAPDTGQTNYAYDGLGQLTQVTDPRGLQTSYTQDGLGNLLQQLSPDTGTTTNTYDSAGNLKTSQDARAKTTSYSYDALNRVSQTTFGDLTKLSYGYDAGTNGLGRLSSLTDPAGSVSFLYDAQGRIKQKQQLIGAIGQSVGYGYDTAGRMISMTYPSGRTVNYGYDTAGRVKSLSVDGVSVLTGIQYQPFGGVSGWTWGNGTAYSRGIDANGRVASFPLGNTQRSLVFDEASRITGYDDGASAQSFGYDAVSRLTSFTGLGQSQSYQYDLVGNRLSLTQGPNTTGYGLSPTANQVTAATTGASTRGFSYDAAGNRATDGSTVYTTNARGRLASVTVGTVTTSYTHNGLGQRVKKAGSVTVYFAYDEQGKLLGNYDSSNRPQQETIYLGDTPVAVLTGDGTLIDNSTTASVTVTGTWPTATTVKGYQGTNYASHAAGSALDSFTWKGPSSAGSYRVYVRYTAAADRASNAPYTVSHSGGVTDIQLNQRVNGGQWVSLGSYSFPANSAQAVKLTASASGVVVADAVKFVPNTSAGIQYVHADHLNTPRVITSTSTGANNVLWRWDSDPFGQGFPNEDVDGNGVKFTYNLRFPGQYFDAETNNFYNYFRDYDPSLGRYAQSDPIGLAGGVNTYQYVSNNPIQWTDPFGLTAKCRVYASSIMSEIGSEPWRSNRIHLSYTYWVEPTQPGFSPKAEPPYFTPEIGYAIWWAEFYKWQMLESKWKRDVELNKFYCTERYQGECGQEEEKTYLTETRTPGVKTYLYRDKVVYESDIQIEKLFKFFDSDWFPPLPGRK